MKKQILTLGLALLTVVAVPVVAMAAPDFNGSWVRDNARSDRDIYPLYWLTRGVDPGGGGGQGNGEYVISIHQDAKGIQVTDPQRALRIVAVDGQAHSVPTDTGVAKATVTASWKSETLEIATVQPYGGMPGNATLTVNEVWSLSPDGKTLTVATTRDVPATKQTMKQVYNRK
jgi:hypothetical protein